MCSLQEEQHRDHVLLEGRFHSPFEHHCPGLLPPQSELAYFQALLPTRWPGRLRPTVVHLAGTGDHVSGDLTCRFSSCGGTAVFPTPNRVSKQKAVTDACACLLSSNCLPRSVRVACLT